MSANNSGQTVVAIGSAMAVKLYSVACFADTVRRPSFRKNMTGPAPKQSDAEKKLKNQTSADYPFVEIRDLSKTAGERVSVDLFNVVSGKPVMGDRKLAGKMMTLSHSSMDIRIDQYRAGIDPGGRMTQQRTLHNLRGIAKSNMSGYANRLEDQLCQVHVYGARGYQNDKEWVVPLESDSDFNTILVNPVLPPTRNRRKFAGAGNTSVDDLDNTDYLTLGDIDRLRVETDEDAFPMQGVRFEGDPQADEDPLYVLLVSSRVWHYILTSTSDQNWRTFLANAYQRATGWKHPLFTGETGLWNGILVKKVRRAIRFPNGSNVAEYDGDDVVQQVATSVDVDRSVLLGAQALGYAYGGHARSGYYMNWHEESTDHGNTIETSIAVMGGKSKLRFEDPDGAIVDHGVMTIDSYAPAPGA